MGQFNNITKRIRLIQSSNSINLNLDANTDIKDIKRLHSVITYIDGSKGEKWVSLGKEIIVNINYLSSNEFKLLRDLWKSKEDITLITERNESFKVRWIQETYDMIEEEDFSGDTFHYNPIVLTEI